MLLFGYFIVNGKTITKKWDSDHHKEREPCIQKVVLSDDDWKKELDELELLYPLFSRQETSDG